MASETQTLSTASETGDVLQRTPPHVVIVGGGFGGLAAAQALRDAPVRVTLVDRANHHLFQPLLYQVATAALSPAEIAAPLRAILRGQRNAAVLLAEVTGVDVARRTVRLAAGPVGDAPADLAYDYLVLAPGAVSAYFGHDDWERCAPSLKSLDDAVEIRRRIFLAFEAAERETEPARRAALLTFVVIGGGPTGVELAGALGEIAHEALRAEFRAINPEDATIYLVDAAPRILLTYPEDLARRAAADLERLGVCVRTGAGVTAIAADAVTLGEERIAAGTMIWTAGVTGSPLGRSLGVPLERGGRVGVMPDLTLPGHPEVFVIGDLAAARDASGNVLPGIAPVALQQGKTAGANIARAVRGEPWRPFHYHDRGTIATIGRNRAVAVIYGRKLRGVLAWVAWALIHIMTLIDYRNRFAVMANWVYAYVTHRRPARLIRAGKH